MTVIFSKKCELGLQSVLFLSTKENGHLFSATEVSKELQQPKEFVSKMLQRLTSSGIVGSRKGKNGGFYLAKDPGDIKLIDIVAAIDGLEVFNSCVLGFPGCGTHEPCPVHNTWGKLRSEAHKMLSEETLEGLKDQTINKLKSMSV
jgi:Rrf2 family transcriptional regulator, iron-sulfur cluster assembly transcription factor